MVLLLTIGVIVAFVLAWVYFHGGNDSDGGDGIDDRPHDNGNDSDSDSDGGDGGDGGGD